MDFITRVTELREERNLTEKEVLTACHLSKNCFTNWKKGGKPAQSAIMVLADFFGVLPEYLEGKVMHRTLDEAADAFERTADDAVSSLCTWLDDNGYEYGEDWNDNGCGVTWFISKDGNIRHYEENEFHLLAVNLAQIIRHSDNFVYMTWASELFTEPPIELSEDEEELIDIFRDLDRPAIHELMAKAYELRDRVIKEKRCSQEKATG